MDVAAVGRIVGDRAVAAGEELRAGGQLGRDLDVPRRSVARIVDDDRVPGGSADKLHGGAIDGHLQRPAVDQHAFRQIDVGAGVAVGFHPDDHFARLPGGQLDFNRPLVACRDRAQAVRDRLAVAAGQRHKRQRDVFGGPVAAVAELQLVEFLFAEEHFPRPVQPHGKLGLLHLDQGLRRRLLEVPVDGQLEGPALPRYDPKRQLFLGMGLDPPQRPATRDAVVGGRRGDLAGARRGAGHVRPIGQADGDGDFLGRLFAGVLQ